MYRFQFGRMPAGRQADELAILSELEAEGSLDDVAEFVRMAVAAAAQQAELVHVPPAAYCDLLKKATCSFVCLVYYRALRLHGVLCFCVA